jgi:hypothetical protein
MPTYTTQYVKNLSTGEPFAFEVTDKWLERFELQKGLIETGNSLMLGTLKNLTEMHEFSFFPAYNKLLEIWNENGFTTELITQILNEFGVHESFMPKLLGDEDYISKLKPWFEGITCDGERASRTMRMVYSQTASYHSLRPQPSIMF